MTSPRYRLDDLVRARSVAVVGASQDPTRIGGRPIAFLQQAGFTGPIYPVNAKYAEVQGLRAYPDLEAIPGSVEVAIVSVPARDVPGVIEACARKGVRAAVVFSSGFGEVGEEGRAQQAALERLARATGVRIVGPNCQGVVALHHRLNLSFSSAFLDWGEPGHVGLAVQSGAVGGMMAALLRERRVGFSHWVSAGNEADVDVAECIDFFARDTATRVIGAYVESIRDGRRLLGAVVAARAAGKPVVILRTGRSAQSRRAAASHTGALASDDAVATALLAHAGATDVRDVTELLDALAMFARVAPPRGRRLGILSNSGGLGVIMADTAARLGLELPAFSPALQQRAGRHPARVRRDRQPRRRHGSAPGRCHAAAESAARDARLQRGRPAHRRAGHGQPPLPGADDRRRHRGREPGDRQARDRDVARERSGGAPRDRGRGAAGLHRRHPLPHGAVGAAPLRRRAATARRAGRLRAHAPRRGAAPAGAGGSPRAPERADTAIRRPPRRTRGREPGRRGPRRSSRSTSSTARPCCAPPGCPRSRSGWSRRARTR